MYKGHNYIHVLITILCACHDIPFPIKGVTNMWQLHYRSKPSSTAVNYLFRSQ